MTEYVLMEPRGTRERFLRDAGSSVLNRHDKLALSHPVTTAIKVPTQRNSWSKAQFHLHKSEVLRPERKEMETKIFLLVLFDLLSALFLCPAA